jgi:hypothetical protein
MPEITLNARPTPFCCHLGCSAPAEYTIYTQRSDGSIAGPDIYSDETESCETHVGALLSYQPDARNPEEIVWLVTPLRDLSDA